MNKKRYPIIVFVFLLFGLLITACAPGQSMEPTPTSTLIPPTFTAPPDPPTTTVTPIPSTPTQSLPSLIDGPILTYGTDSWKLISVEACSFVHTGPAGTPNNWFTGPAIRLTFECTTNKPLFSVMQTYDGSPFQAAYLTGASHNKYPSVQVGGGGLDSCTTVYIVFTGVPTDQKEFQLYFMDVPPIPVPEPTYQDDCPYKE